jgi:hypothetical protein
MRSRRIYTTALLCSCVLLAAPAVAQNAAKPGGTPTTPQSAPKTGSTQAVGQNAPQPPDANEDFILGLRRVGVLAGQAVECAPDADRHNKFGDVMDLADQIAIHFGLKAAFNFVGAVGYGSGHGFDKATCQQTIAQWSEVQAKYAKQ